MWSDDTTNPTEGRAICTTSHSQNVGRDACQKQFRELLQRRQNQFFNLAFWHARLAVTTHGGSHAQPGFSIYCGLGKHVRREWKRKRCKCFSQRVVQHARVALL